MTNFGRLSCTAIGDPFDVRENRISSAEFMMIVDFDRTRPQLT
jgi:hypothetical protein